MEIFSPLCLEDVLSYSADYIAVNTWNMSGMFIVLKPITDEIFAPQRPQATNGFLSTTEEIIFVLFKETSYLVRNLKHRCSPRSALRTASSTSFEFRKKNFTSQRDATTTSFQGSDITWRW